MFELSEKTVSKKKSFSVSKNEKQSIALIQIGTFLEYFDLYLYIHMAVVLNTVFFPKTDPYTSSLLAAFTFSSTFLLRPLGALIFGYIGDNISRKASVVITTLIMAGCSLVIASTPSYEQIGIYSSIILIVCRMLQGISSVGEITGARIYICEITKPPHSYFYVELVNFFAVLGGFFALLIGSFFLFANAENGWRTAFYFGSAIAVVGSIARTKLRETPEFIKAKTKIKSKIKMNYLLRPKAENKKNFLYYLAIESINPITFYFSFVYLSEILMTKFQFTPQEVLYNNTFVAFIQLIALFLCARLAIYIYPLKILRFRLLTLSTFLLIMLFGYQYIQNPIQIFMFQCAISILGGDSKPAQPLFIKSFPVIGRYTQTALAFALSRTFMYIITAYACVFIGKYFGVQGVMLGFMFFTIIAIYSAFSFKEKMVSDAGTSV